MSEQNENDEGVTVNLPKSQLRLILIIALLICLFIPVDFEAGYYPMIAYTFMNTLSLVRGILYNDLLSSFDFLGFLTFISVFLFYWAPLLLVLLFLWVRAKPSLASKNAYLVFLLVFYAVIWFGVRVVAPVDMELRLYYGLLSAVLILEVLLLFLARYQQIKESESEAEDTA